MPTQSLQDRAAGALMGAFIGDALALGPHWYYDLDELRADYGDWISGYTDPRPGRYHAGLKAGQASQAGVLLALTLAVSTLSLGAGRTKASRGRLAFGVARHTALKHGVGQRGRRKAVLGQFDGPQRALHAGQVARVGDLLVAQEFGPRSRGRVGKVVGRPLAQPVPARLGLRSRQPEEAEAGIAVPEADAPAHAASGCGPDSTAARARTRAAAASSGVHAAPSVCRGLLPSSWLRGRSNQRRIPKSL